MPSWTNTPSGTMRAVTLTAAGATPPSSSFAPTSSYPKPTLPNQNWLLVRVRAAGLNRSELRQRNAEPANPRGFGPFASEYHPEPPAVLGEEFAGEVEVAGTETGFKTGDRVVGAYYGGGKAYYGTYAEYTIVRADVCYRLPGPEDLKIGDGSGEVAWTDLAAFPGSGWTAWGSLFQLLLAKARGCIVIATTRQEGKIERLRAMGATHVVVEKTDEGGSSNYGKMVKDVLAIRADGVDTFVELVDSNSYNQLAFRVTAKFGTVAIAGVLGKGFAPQPFTPAMIPGTRRLSMHVGFEIADGVEECFREIAFGIRDGVFKSENFLDSVYKLEDVGKAHDEMQANLVCGKVFLDI